MASASAGLGLDEQLCFDLYAASRAVTARYRQLLAPLGLTYPQYLVMIVMWERGAVTLSQLGEALQLDSGTLSPLVKRLAADGLVVKSRGTADERTVTVAPTPAGRALRRRAQGIPAQICAAMGFPPVPAHQLRDMLRELSAHVRAECDGSAA